MRVFHLQLLSQGILKAIQITRAPLNSSGESKKKSRPDQRDIKEKEI